MEGVRRRRNAKIEKGFIIHYEKYPLYLTKILNIIVIM